MKRWEKPGRWPGLAIWLGMCALVFVPLSLWFKIIGCLLLAAAGIAWVLQTEWGREEGTSAEGSSEEALEQLLDILKHQRHDWLNDVQLLYGYAKLNKLDKFEEYVDKIKNKLYGESHTSRLGLPSLVVELLAFRFRCSGLKFKVEVGEGADLSRFEVKLDRLIMSVLERLAAQAKQPDTGMENRLQLYIYPQEDGLKICFAYQGEHDGGSGTAEQLRREVEAHVSPAAVRELAIAESGIQLELLLQESGGR